MRRQNSARTTDSGGWYMELIDASLRAYRQRESVPAAELLDVLLDLRYAIAMESEITATLAAARSEALAAPA
jgi:hypothetical protein